MEITKDTTTLKSVQFEEYIVNTEIFVRNNKKNKFVGVYQPTNSSPANRSKSKFAILIPNGIGSYNRIPHYDGVTLITKKEDMMNVFFKNLNADQYNKVEIFKNYLTDHGSYDSENYYRNELKIEDALTDMDYSVYNEYNMERLKKYFEKYHVEYKGVSFSKYKALEIIYLDDMIIRSEAYVNQHAFEYYNIAEFYTTWYRIREIPYPKLIIKKSTSDLDFSSKNEKYKGFIPYLKITSPIKMLNKLGEEYPNDCFDYILSSKLG